MNCLKCNKEIQGDFKVCPYCGTKVIENGILCPHCDEVVSGEFEVCTNCGKRFDGKRVCSHCGTIVESDYNFCPKCAKRLVSEEPIKTVKPAPSTKPLVAPVKKKTSKVTKKKIQEMSEGINIIDLVKRSVVLVLAILIFAFSFTNIFKFDFLGDEMSTVDVGVSTFDFADSWDMNKSYGITRFSSEYRDELHDYEKALESADSVYHYIDATEDFLNSVNPIKFAKIAMEFPDQFALPQRIVLGVTGILLILASAGFVIETGYGIYAAIVKKENKGIKFPLFEGLIVAFYIVAKTFSMNYALINVEPGSMFNAMVVLAAVSAFIKFAYLLFQELKETQFKEWLAPSMRLGKIVLLVLAAFFVTAPIFKVAVSTDEIRYDTELKYDAFDILSLKIAVEADNDIQADERITHQEYADIYDMYIEDLSEYYIEGYEEAGHFVTSYILSPVWIEYRVWNPDDTVMIIVASAFQVVALGLILTYLAFELSYIKKGKSVITFFNILAWIAGIAITVVAYSTYTQMMEDFRITSIEDIKYGILQVIGLSLVVPASILSLIGSKDEEEIEEELIERLVEDATCEEEKEIV